MKTIKNKTHAPLRVPLPRGKTLHLGPGKEGQVAYQDVEHKGLQKLVKAGKIEIVGEGSATESGRELGRAPHEATHGHTPQTSRGVKGDR
jgi:hypothetical protein